VEYRPNEVHLSAAVALFLSGCTSPEQHDRDQLTDRIESLVKLPEGAERLAYFARTYTFDERGLVVGVFASGNFAPKLDDICSEMFEDFSSREVPCSPEFESDRLLAGQRQWVDGEDKLPLILDGGCDVITIIYDPKADKVVSANCNVG